jgi:competence protein ComEA
MDGPAAWRVLEDPVEQRPAGPDGPAGGASGSGRLVPIVALGAAALLAIAGIILTVSGNHPTIDVEGGSAAASDVAAVDPSNGHSRSSAAQLVVDVQGAVAHPGVVRLDAGARVGDAITASGGYGPRVDVARVARSLNMAALVHDGDQIVVPSRDDPEASTGRQSPGPGGGGGTGGGSGTTAPLDLNTATATELDSLPGIGPVTAAKIIAAREDQKFSTVEDLRTRKLVGSATFDKLKALVTVR